MSFRPVQLPGPMVLVLARELVENTRTKLADHPSLAADPARWQAGLDGLLASGVPATFRQPARAGDLAFDVALLSGGTPEAFEQHGTGDDPALVLHVGSYVMFLKGAHRGYAVTDVGPLRPQDHDLLADGCLLVRPTAWVLVNDVGQVPPESDTYWSTLRSAYDTLGRERAAEVRSSQVTSEQHEFLDQVDRLIGATEPIASPGVARSQRAAVKLLRTGQTPNIGLLPALADGRVLPLMADRVEPPEPLDDPQTEAFRKALAAKDLLLVEGPPGTGKTRTISQIVRACTGIGERVLVTSRTDHGTDAVLARLPSDLLVIRLDDDGELIGNGPYAVDEQVRVLRHRVAGGIEGTLSAYDDIEAVERLAAELGQLTGELGAAIAEESAAQATLNRAQEGAGGSAQARVEALAARHQQLTDELRQGKEEIEDLIERRRRARTRTGWQVGGRLFAVQVRYYDQQLAALRTAATEGRRQHHRLGRELAAAERERDANAGADPEVLAATDALEKLRTHSDDRRDAALQAADAVNRALHAITATSSVPAVPAVAAGADADAQQVYEALTELREWLIAWLPVLAARGRLLAEWVGNVAQSTGELGPELVRYAQVIAATTPAGTQQPEVAGPTDSGGFDLAIVDEAGQMSVADVLLPLARARRGILFGNHQQVPPWHDSELDGESRLLATSAFEWLASEQPLPASNIVHLRTQRRMPPSIADFASTAFYDGALGSGTDESGSEPDRRAATETGSEPEPDELFERALVFVDTSALPESHRFESQRSADHRPAGQESGSAGYINVAEAELLIRLAIFYHRRLGRDAWAIVVPYQTQVAKITGMLGRLIGDPPAAERNVGTSNDFQGGERAVVIYGFTRSNSRGEVGLLTGPRHLSTAFTMAERRLVLVGDLSMLANANDKTFRKLMRSLRSHVSKVGELVPHADIDQRLGEIDRQSRGGNGGP